MVELSKTEDIADGETVTVMASSFLPGNTATVLTCFNFPVAGPGDCDFSNMGQFTATVGEDGTATIDYVVTMVPDKCDESTPCYVIVSDGIGPSSNSAAQLVTFAAAAPPEPEPTPEPTPAATEAPEPTPAPTQAAPEPEPTAEPEPVEEVAAPATDDDDGGSSVWVWLLPVIIVVAVLALIGLWLMRRRAAT
ncbi:MAG: hypothetical protein OXE45_12765 [bacterium]|nr:hypothetical protein [bacterium]